MQKIALIGPMGSGKTTLSMLYRSRYGGNVIDTDSMFTARYGEISSYIAAHGESEFRKLEHEVVISAANSGADIISCGGGVVLDKRNMSALRKHYSIVYLTAPVDVLKERIKDSDRPLKHGIEKIVAEREHLYRRYADYTIDTSNGDVVKKLTDALSSSRPNRYDILLCDADDTVLDFQKAMRISVLGAARAVGIKTKDDDIIRCYKKILPSVWGALERSEISHTDLNNLRFEYLREALGESFDAKAMNLVYIEEMKKTRYLLSGSTEFLSAVRARGIKVYIVTNGFAEIAHERLKALDGYIDGSFVSDDVGYNKPDPRFFDCVLNELGFTDKSRILVFGDSVNSDICGGINSGIDTCLYDPSGAIECNADYTVRCFDELLRIL